MTKKIKNEENKKEEYMPSGKSYGSKEDLEQEIFNITCLLDNGQKAIIELPENNWDEGYAELEIKIRNEEFFDAEAYGGSIEINSGFINALNCKKVLGFIYD